MARIRRIDEKTRRDAIVKAAAKLFSKKGYKATSMRDLDNEWKHLNEPHFSDFHNRRRVYRKRFSAIVAKGVQAGELKNVDAPTAVLIMLHAISGIASWHRAHQKTNATEPENSMITIIVDGVKK